LAKKIPTLNVSWGECMKKAPSERDAGLPRHQTSFLRHLFVERLVASHNLPSEASLSCNSVSATQ